MRGLPTWPDLTWPDLNINISRALWSQTGPAPVLPPDLRLRLPDLTAHGPGPARPAPDLSPLTPPTLSRLTPSSPPRSWSLTTPWSPELWRPCWPPGPAPLSATPLRPPRLPGAMHARRHQNDGSETSTWLVLRARLMKPRLCTRFTFRTPARSSESPWPRGSARSDTTWRRRERNGWLRTTRSPVALWSRARGPWWPPTLTLCQPAPPCLMPGTAPASQPGGEHLTQLFIQNMMTAGNWSSRWNIIKYFLKLSYIKHILTVASTRLTIPFYYSETSAPLVFSDTLQELEVLIMLRLLERLMRTVGTRSTRTMSPPTLLITDSNQLNNPR